MKNVVQVTCGIKMYSTVLSDTPTYDDLLAWIRAAFQMSSSTNFIMKYKGKF